MTDKTTEDRAWGGVAFLLAQVGAYAASAFAERVSEVGLTPPQAGLLRLVAMRPGQAQRAYAAYLRMPPSRFVSMVDALEERGIVERRRAASDRRANELHLTDAGNALMRQLAAVGRAHEDAMCAALDPEERRSLRAWLVRIAADRGLTPGAHPGYRRRPGDDD